MKQYIAIDRAGLASILRAVKGLEHTAVFVTICVLVAIGFGQATARTQPVAQRGPKKSVSVGVGALRGHPECWNDERGPRKCSIYRTAW